MTTGKNHSLTASTTIFSKNNFSKYLYFLLAFVQVVEFHRRKRPVLSNLKFKCCCLRFLSALTEFSWAVVAVHLGN